MRKEVTARGGGRWDSSMVGEGDCLVGIGERKSKEDVYFSS